MHNVSGVSPHAQESLVHTVHLIVHMRGKRVAGRQGIRIFCSIQCAHAGHAPVYDNYR
jgi:hypothetical protein